jgi:hypothetical protein
VSTANDWCGEVKPRADARIEHGRAEKREARVQPAPTQLKCIILTQFLRLTASFDGYQLDVNGSPYFAANAPNSVFIIFFIHALGIPGNQKAVWGSAYKYFL